MRTFVSSRMKRKSFYRKSELQMFLLLSGGHIKIGGQFLFTNNGVSIQSSTKVREMFRQITQKLWTTKTFFHWTVSNLFFCAVFTA